MTSPIKVCAGLVLTASLTINSTDVLSAHSHGFTALGAVPVAPPLESKPTTPAPATPVSVSPAVTFPVAAEPVAPPPTEPANVADVSMSALVKPTVPDQPPGPAISAVEPVNQVQQTSTEVTQEKVWHVNEGATLRQVIESWCAEAGWSVVWATELNYPIRASFTVSGDFVDAIEQIFAAYALAPEKLSPAIYSNNVLHVEQMNQSR